MNNLALVKAITEWVKLFGMTPMPEDVVAWHKKSQAESDCVLDYSEEDTRDELYLLDSFEEEVQPTEDRENSQDLAMELMEYYG
tara:strand:+ start:448 stop:699 length:252 start_codon:yes stop_codon:yes gene_type:complete